MSWLADLLGVREILANGVALVQRRKVNFIGAEVSAADNPTTGRTDVTVSAFARPLDPEDNGKVPIADSGALAYLGGTTTGDVLTWNGTTWIADPVPARNSPPVTYSDESVIAQLSDGGEYLRLTHATPDFEIPPNTDVAFPVGVEIVVVGIQGSFTITEGSGVTVNIPPSRSLASFEAFSSILLKKVATDEWDAIGDLALA